MYMLWVVRKMVAPSSFRFLTMSLISLAMAGSRPVVGSSRNQSSGRFSMLRAKVRRCFMPFENSPAFFFATWSRPTVMRSSIGSRVSTSKSLR